MEEEDEILSNPSAGTGSPASPMSNGRITVTVAAVPPPQNTLAVALPIQQPRTTGGGGGREDCWSEGATAVLIDAWGERYLELSRGNLKQKHWKDVADIVSSREDYTRTPKTDIQCKNRIDTVKKKYKLEKSKIVGGTSKWPFFERLDELIGSTAKTAGTSSITPALPSKVPMGIPVGVRSVNQFPQQQKSKRLSRRRALVDSDWSVSEPDASPDSTDSFPPDTYERKKPRRIQRELMNLNSVRSGMVNRGRKGGGGGKDKKSGSSVRELTWAILKFSEAYELAESSKLQQLVEMEKQKMRFSKELELQRMQFFMKIQFELSQVRYNNRRVRNTDHHRSSNKNHNNDRCN